MDKTARRLLLARIHIAQKALGWDDDIYRDNLYSLTGKDSCRTMSQSELQRVVVELEKRMKPQSIAADSEWDNEPMRGKCRALAYELTESFGEHDSTRMTRYLDGIAKRMCGGRLFRYASGEQLHNMIAAMEIEKNNRRIAQAHQERADAHRG